MAWEEIVALLSDLTEEEADRQAALDIAARIAAGEESVRDWAEFEAELDDVPA